MSTAPDGDASTARLNQVYGLYTAGFAALMLLLALLNAIGVPDIVIGCLFVGFTLLSYVVIGIAGRTMRVDEYYVAGRRVPAVYNGMATGAGWLSSASFLGLAGTLYLLGHDGLAFVLGWTGGYVLAAVLVAPFLRKSGAYTVPDFLAARYGALARFIAVLVLFSCCFALLVAQFSAAGIVSARFLGLDFTAAVLLALAVILLCAVPGGMRSLTWTQVAQYIVLIVAFLVPAVWMSAAMTGIPLPPLMQGEAIGNILRLEALQGVAPSHVAPFAADGHDRLNTALLVLCLMAGTASMPHVLMRCLTAPSARAARSSLVWALFFIAFLYLTAPAYAAFAKWTMLELVQGGLTADNIATRAGWLLDWARTDATLVRICGEPALDAAAVAAACGAQGVERLAFADIALHPDIIVLATPEMAGMPYVVSALVAAGALTAALAAAAGLLVAVANAFGHDLYHRTVDPRAPSGRRLIVSRILLLLTAAGAAWVATTRPADLITLVSWTFSLAASGLFPALVLGVWWKRANKAGAAAGMAAGFGVCLYYLVATRYGAVAFVEIWGWLSAATPDEMARFAELEAVRAAASGEAAEAARAALDGHARTIANWGGVSSLSAAAFGVPVGFAVTIVVSLLTKAPSKETRDFVDEIRRPRGRTPIEQTAS